MQMFASFSSEQEHFTDGMYMINHENEIISSWNSIAGFLHILFFYKKIKTSASIFTVTIPLPRKVPDVTKEQIYVNAISRKFR